MQALAGTLLIVGLIGLGGPARASTQPEVEVHHIHGLALLEAKGVVLHVATHTGLVRIRPGAPPERVGLHRFDLMGLTTGPREQGVVYASGHPDLATYRREPVGNLGLLASQDGGATWRSVALRGQADFHALAWSPRDGGRLYGWSVAGEPGLYRISTADWRAERLPAPGLAGVLALAASPDPDGPVLAGTRTGLVVSRDGGVSWVDLVGPVGAKPVTALAFHPAERRLVYAATAHPATPLLRSGDEGTSWEPVALALPPGETIVAVAVGRGSDVAVATSRSTVLLTRDGGRTWTSVLEWGRAPTR